ncbi:hypothetical protein DID88_008551 [Monilinia fructigena]|uniref:MICOS complex subunit MIC60 n=1 Tax=Monilinia fructigena TaxID=38457 RepID=A0A395J6S7_9HELO|nr:hypothetical protein DID88_008551 [Monilinia fructigena]
MLRAGLRSTRTLGLRPNVVSPGRQWMAQNSRVISDTKRSYSDKPSIPDSRSPVLPGSASAATSEHTTTRSNSNSKFSCSNTSYSKLYHNFCTKCTSYSSCPRSSNTRTSPPSTPPPPAPKPKRRFFRKFFTTLFLLTALGFGGGVYYSRINDNFHDFFTEYVPFGEEAVLYFEEQEFRKRFPLIVNRAPRPPRDTGEQVKIPSQSGVSWRVANENREPTGRHTNSKPADRIQAVEQVKESPAPAATPEPKPSNPQRDPEVNEPSKAYKKIERIDPISIPNGNELIVQELVKIMNDVIAVVNADNAGARFSSTMDKAKTELNRVAAKILGMKETALQEADEKIKG